MTIPFTEAQALEITTATDDDLQAAWHSYATQISYHHADDSGREWGLAGKLMTRAREIETEIHRRELPRPTGMYLMGPSDRIDWETGAWEQGWVGKKARAA